MPITANTVSDDSDELTRPRDMQMLQGKYPYGVLVFTEIHGRHVGKYTENEVDHSIYP